MIRGKKIPINLIDPHDGVCAATSAQPPVCKNKVVWDQDYGLCSASSVKVHALHNWCGSAAGPNPTDDTVYGADICIYNRALSPSEIQQLSDDRPLNSAPFIPADPSPKEGSVNVPVPSVTLRWTGGDPDPGNTVTYDVLWGTSAEALDVVAENISAASYGKRGLAWNFTYYWQMITGAERTLDAGQRRHLSTQKLPSNRLLRGRFKFKVHQ